MSRIRLRWAGVFVSVLVVTDLFMRLFCSAWPLAVYLVVGGVGAWLAVGLHQRISGETLVACFLRRVANILSTLSALGLIVLFFLPVNWESKCSWRYCDRALGVGLFMSPFPVGTPTCKGWSVCANESPLSNAQYEKVLRSIRQQGCPEP